MGQREIFRSGARYEHCDVLYQEESYMICQDGTGQQFLARPGMGTWMEICLQDLIGELKWHESRTGQAPSTEKPLTEAFTELVHNYSNAGRVTAFDVLNAALEVIIQYTRTFVPTQVAREKAVGAFTTTLRSELLDEVEERSHQ